MNAKNGAPVLWHLEFAKVTSCTRCGTATDVKLLRDASENLPQPGYIGAGYERTRLLLVGQNPGLSTARSEAKDQRYTAALQALRADPSVQNYADLRTILDDFIREWPVHGQYFPLEECGLNLADIAYFNFVRCRSARMKGNAKLENATPNDSVAENCRRMHFEPWLDMLKPRGVVFIGIWACRRGKVDCDAMGIPYVAVNRKKDLRREERAEIRSLVCAFVAKILRTGCAVAY